MCLPFDFSILSSDRLYYGLGKIFNDLVLLEYLRYTTKLLYNLHLSTSLH